MDTSILEEIGLTGAEIKVFLTLLELGSSSAGAVVERSGLQNAVVHRAFHSLAEKGLLTYVMEGKIRQYQAIEPKLLLNFIDEKKMRLEKLMPELESKRNMVKEKPKARIFQGVRGIKELLNLMIETDSKEYAVYGAAVISDRILGNYFWENFHNKKIKKKIKSKLLFHPSLTWWGKKISKLPLIEVRITPKHFEETTETVICGNKVAIIIYMEKPFGFLIEEESAAKSYMKFFKVLWGQKDNIDLSRRQ